MGKVPPPVSTCAEKPCWKFDPYAVSMATWFTFTWLGEIELIEGLRLGCTTWKVPVALPPPGFVIRSVAVYGALPPIVTCTCTWFELTNVTPGEAMGKVPPLVSTCAEKPCWKLD